MNIFKFGDHDLPIPSNATEGSAGYDLRSVVDVILFPGFQEIIPTGFGFEIPNGFMGQIWDRSGLAAKYGVGKLAGIIDSDYRGEVKIVAINHGVDPYHINVGDRIAQLVLVACFTPPLSLIGIPSETSRGENGFGSTGK